MLQQLKIELFLILLGVFCVAQDGLRLARASHGDIRDLDARVLSQRASVCNQDTLDRTFITQCGPSLCEPAFEEAEGNKRAGSEWPAHQDEVVQIISSREGSRFKLTRHQAIDTDEPYYEESHLNGSIFVETETKYQRILGFGTTLTDASCKNVDDLPNETRSSLINDYFNPDTGIGINLIRVPIGSTKYSYTNYVLDQPDSNQVELSPYDVDHRIPLIRDALKAAGKFSNRIKILASSATAPPEMKRNNKLVHGGLLRQDKFEDYAAYLVGYISAYKTQGLSVWSLIMNEWPASNAAHNETSDHLDYSSMAMRPSDAIKLIKSINNVVARRRSEVDRFRLLLLGDSRVHSPVWADAVFQRNDVAQSVAGIAYNVDPVERYQPYDNLIYVSRRFTNKYLLTAQGANNSPMKLGNWQYAENYANEMVKNLEYGSVGWIDFNMALDLEGGPCINEKFKSDAAVIVDAKRSVYYRNPMFYAIGHLSRYVKPGSIRVKSTILSSAQMYAHQQIAFITPDNFLVVFVSNDNIGPMPISIGINKRTKVERLLDTKSFNTFIFRL